MKKSINHLSLSHLFILNRMQINALLEIYLMIKVLKAINNQADSFDLFCDWQYINFDKKIILMGMTLCAKKS